MVENVQFWALQTPAGHSCSQEVLRYPNGVRLSNGSTASISTTTLGSLGYRSIGLWTGGYLCWYEMQSRDIFVARFFFYRIWTKDLFLL